MASWTRRNWRKTDRASGIGPIPRSKKAIFLSYGRTSPESLCRTHNNRTPYAVEVAGGGRSSAINRRMSAKRFFGMATSAIWNAT